MWSLRKVENGHLVGDDPNPEAHGAVVPLEGGLLLNGNDSWLDLGNFEGLDIKYFRTDLKYLYVYFRGCHGLRMSGKYVFSQGKEGV